jgi:hypothetical protein
VNMAIPHKALAFQRTTILVLLLLSLAVLAAQSVRAQSGSGQEVLTNESIIKMVKAEVGENVILQMIDSHPGNYNMTADGVVQLKQQGVPENIISAMMVKGPASSNSTAAPVGPSAHASSSPNSSSGPACPSQLGAYYLDGASWKPMSQVITEGSSAHVKPIPFATSAKGVLRFRDPAAPITLGETPKLLPARQYAVLPQYRHRRP